MKEFDLRKAKAGAPVCTRDGRNVRIICYDMKSLCFPIAALIDYGEYEVCVAFTLDGKWNEGEGESSCCDLMMADIPTIHHEGWINILYNNYGSDDVALGQIYNRKEFAENNCPDGFHTVKIEWEDEV